MSRLKPPSRTSKLGSGTSKRQCRDRSLQVGHRILEVAHRSVDVEIEASKSDIESWKSHIEASMSRLRPGSQNGAIFGRYQGKRLRMQARQRAARNGMGQKSIMHDI